MGGSEGTAILWKSTNDNRNNFVKNSIFLNNDQNEDNRYAFTLSSGDVNINDNWWGNLANEY